MIHDREAGLLDVAEHPLEHCAEPGRAAHVVEGLPREPGVRIDQLQIILNSLWGIYENAYLLNERGLLGEVEWGRFERLICAEVARGRRDDRWSSPGGSRGLLTEQCGRVAIRWTVRQPSMPGAIQAT